MPPLFQSISNFRISLESLCRKEKYGYHSCNKDICDALSGLSFDDIWEMKFLLRELENIRLIKLRIKNSHQNLSSSDGFRLIICCNRKYQSVTFLNIYPKRGKLGRLDQSKEEYKQQLRTYLTAMRENTLILHDIKNNLEEIKQ